MLQAAYTAHGMENRYVFKCLIVMELIFQMSDVLNSFKGVVPMCQSAEPNIN